MADMHQLENKMRVLKLSGMVDTLDMRLNQAQKDGVGLREFLELLLEDEVQHRANKRLATRMGRWDTRPAVPAIMSCSPSPAACCQTWEVAGPMTPGKRESRTI